MKIALIKRRYSLRHGGSERYCVNLARKLISWGHDVSIIGETIDDEMKEEVPFFPVSVNRLTSWTNNQSFAVNSGEIAKKNQFDIVYGIGRVFGVDAVRVTERIQSHWIKIRYDNPVSYQLQRWNPRHRTMIGLEREIYNSPTVRKIVTQSQLDRKLVIDNYGIPEEKIRTIYNGVDSTAFHPGMKKYRKEVRDEIGINDSDYLLIFASMDFEGKGLQYILKSISESQVPGLKLAVLGNGPVAKFRKLSKDLNISNQIHFLGRRNDIAHFYGAGDLFLLPTAYEPFPNVNLEAMACGLPVITTKTSGGMDIIQERKNGYLVNEMSSVEEMKNCFDHYFSLNNGDRKTMSDHCVQLAQDMTIDNNAKQTLEMFEEILNEKSRV
jgi:UDP-glucose:(heptosyl)LPS alpha-1,3-glucosyltransferase